MEDLRAEAAADIGRHHPQLVLGQLQHERAHEQANDVRVLARGVERVLAGAAVELADRRARFDRVGDEAVVDDLEMRDVRGFGESGVDRALVAEMPVVQRLPGAFSCSADAPGLSASSTVTAAGSTL